MLQRWHTSHRCQHVRIPRDNLSRFLHWTCLVLLGLTLATPTCGFVQSSKRVQGAPHIAALRDEVEDLFYHGFDNYMWHAFPEDEIRPLTCKPLTRDPDDPSRIEVNDALGNYSLTLIDSLSTLAILASSSTDTEKDGPLQNKPRRALKAFQSGVRDVVEQYGDGSDGPNGEGFRARGFDLDSKVQVFETVIRGVGGLLSAHLFAVGELPIRGYSPAKEEAEFARTWRGTNVTHTEAGIRWPNGFVYDGQLLRLAFDLGGRLLPAFWTSTGIPYPRVNLRHGAPFYANSPGNHDPAQGQCSTDEKGSGEITETCSAGAGSLVLEFTVLSRLTGDSRFEDLAKRAFWSVWQRRSEINLIGAGIDAETGVWQHAWTGIGAGIDSFFEYAFKSHILLSEDASAEPWLPPHARDPRALFEPLSDYEHSPQAFLDAWETAHAAIKRHVYRGANYQHPHYVQVDISTGASRAFWVDSLSAYYPGLLALSGYVEEAAETHLVSAALWTRYSALPERYNMITGGIEGGLGWWVGRPEFIESTWYLYRATEDPWYIYVGEMVLRDIKRRCWATCGWTSLQNVDTGEQADRMESFFLGETAKYLYLLFDPDHPLNMWDAPFVFSTEGHPLVIPRKAASKKINESNAVVFVPNEAMCPVSQSPAPLSISRTAARGDLYHAASLARLHLRPKRDGADSWSRSPEHDTAVHPGVRAEDVFSPTNFISYPWTLPVELVPGDGMSLPLPVSPTFELTFPAKVGQPNSQPPLQRVKEGIMINVLGGLKLSMIQDVPIWEHENVVTGYRIQSINNIALGKDEKVLIGKDVMDLLNPADPHFKRMRDSVMLDLVIDVRDDASNRTLHDVDNTDTGYPNDGMAIEVSGVDSARDENAEYYDREDEDHAVVVYDEEFNNDRTMKLAFHAILNQLSNMVKDGPAMMLPFGRQPTESREIQNKKFQVAAIMPTGIGAAPLPDWPEVSMAQLNAGTTDGTQPIDLLWTTIYMADQLCGRRLPRDRALSNQIIVIKRGGCSFSQKLSRIQATAPARTSLQLVIVVDYETPMGQGDTTGTVYGDFQTRPLLDQQQRTATGLVRPHPIPMVMVSGGDETYEVLRRASSIGLKRRYSMTSSSIPIANLVIV